MHMVGQMALEMQDLKPSLLSPLTTKQPTLRLTSSGTTEKALHARAWTEDLIGGVGVCIHTIVLNSENSFHAIDLDISFAGLAGENIR